ncbi:MAG: hypothetical protein GEU97_24420 [Actinophytocola sp.]|nr:hypothetical protein [Actinophytocola sp.]
MSPIAIIAIVVGGILLFGGALTWFLIWNNRNYQANKSAALERLAEQTAQRGWTYEERNDSYAEVYNAYHASAPRTNPLAPHKPHAHSARDVITGTHRGRPFFVARLDVFQPGDVQREATSSEAAPIMVRTPGPGRALSVRRAVAMQAAVNAGLGITLSTGHPEFDKQFEVHGEDEQFARAVLHPALIKFLLTDPRQPRAFWLGGGYIDALHEMGDHIDPNNLVPALDLRCDILDRIPQQVWV